MRYLPAFIALLPSLVIAAEPVNLDEASYKPELAVILLEANWGRTWKCGEFENAQLQSLTFTRSPIDNPESNSLELKTPSKLFAKDEFVPYALVIPPGAYVLTGFDVKVARSVREIAHIRPSKEHLVKDGKPVGSFNVAAGEIIYLGHFGLDCGAEPFFWRYYILGGRSEFEKYVEGFRKKYPFTRQVPVEFRLFSTRVLGLPVGLSDAVVK